MLVRPHARPDPEGATAVSRLREPSGTGVAPTMPDEVRPAMLAAASAAREVHAAGRADERARVLAWLRGATSRHVNELCDRVERGEHLDD